MKQEQPLLEASDFAQWSSQNNIVYLPSGTHVDLSDSNAGACRTRDDAQELMQALQEKIIDIEYQIDCFNRGYWPNGRIITPNDRPDPTWLPRARKAMAWAKLHKADAQHRFQAIAATESKNEAAERQVSRERLFVNCAKGVLEKTVFDRIMDLAISLQNNGIEASQEIAQ